MEGPRSPEAWLARVGEVIAARQQAVAACASETQRLAVARAELAERWREVEVRIRRLNRRLPDAGRPSPPLLADAAASLRWRAAAAARGEAATGWLDAVEAALPLFRPVAPWSALDSSWSLPASLAELLASDSEALRTSILGDDVGTIRAASRALKGAYARVETVRRECERLWSDQAASRWATISALAARPTRTGQVAGWQAALRETGERLRQAAAQWDVEALSSSVQQVDVLFEAVAHIRGALDEQLAADRSRMAAVDLQRQELAGEQARRSGGRRFTSGAMAGLGAGGLTLGVGLIAALVLRYGMALGTLGPYLLVSAVVATLAAGLGMFARMSAEGRRDAAANADAQDEDRRLAAEAAELAEEVRDLTQTLAWFRGEPTPAG